MNAGRNIRLNVILWVILVKILLIVEIDLNEVLLCCLWAFIADMLLLI